MSRGGEGVRRRNIGRARMLCRMPRPLLLVRGVVRPYPHGGPHEHEVHWYWGVYDPKTHARLDAGPMTGGDLPELIPDVRAQTLRDLKKTATRVARTWITEGQFREHGRSFRLTVGFTMGTPVLRRNPDDLEITGEELHARQEGLVLHLRAAPNPAYEGGYNAAVSIPWRHLPVATLEQASRRSRAFVEDNDLGSGNFAAGGITRDGMRYARVSYNGRVWRYQAEDNYAFPSTSPASGRQPVITILRKSVRALNARENRRDLAFEQNALGKARLLLKRGKRPIPLTVWVPLPVLIELVDQMSHERVVAVTGRY